MDVPIFILAASAASILKLPVEVNIVVVVESIAIVPAESNSIANAFISTLVEASLPIVIVLAADSVPILIASVPTVSIANTPPELKVIVSTESNSIAVAFISTLVDVSLPIVIVLAAFSVPILIASVPTVSISNVPPELKVIEPTESNSIAIAFTSTLVDASLPIVIVLAEALVPILIAEVS